METEKKYLLVDSNPNLVRDVHSKAIVNINETAYEKYMKQSSKMNTQKREIEKLNSEVGELRNMLKQLLERK